MPDVTPVPLSLVYDPTPRTIDVTFSGPIDPASLGTLGAYAWRDGSDVYVVDSATPLSANVIRYTHQAIGSTDFGAAGLYYAVPPGVLEGTNGLRVAPFFEAWV